MFGGKRPISERKRDRKTEYEPSARGKLSEEGWRLLRNWILATKTKEIRGLVSIGIWNHGDTQLWQKDCNEGRVLTFNTWIQTWICHL